uniref:Uncharacterized protein n=1 Tax=Solanum lycopersicum TaxID=4081 RepID=A0A3Q7EEV9_SOLLC
MLLWSWPDVILAKALLLPRNLPLTRVDGCNVEHKDDRFDQSLSGPFQLLQVC